MGHESFLSLFVIVEYLFEFPIDVLTAQPTGDDGAVGGEENDVGDTADIVDVGGYLLCIDDLRIGNAVILDGFQSVFGLVPCGDADDLQTTVLIFVVGFDDVGDLLTAGAAPRSPEVCKHILASAHVITKSGGLSDVLYGEVHKRLADRGA